MARAAKRDTRGAKETAADIRESIIVAFMAVAGERDFGDIGMADVADRAGISLAQLREVYAGKLGILAGFSRKIDLAVLAEGPADPESPARDRLFEVMMRRFDALTPYKPAIRRMACAAGCDPALAMVLHRLALRSQRWTLSAAGLRESGLPGRIAAKGLVLVYAEAMRAWLKDDDPDLGRTMAALDRALRRGERGMKMLCDLQTIIPGFGRRGSRPTGDAAPAA
ncbi:TetR/AcrR family transcriptional regulator [Bauldia sp.]|uniref:TetR/AcrR family transcriptional regulator n=1 Tax=Bauldia sp. TaxID=2575872 RepID=UPI003BAB500D